MADGPANMLNPLDEQAVEQATQAGLAAIEQAQSLAELKEARLAHTGDAAPLTLANREVGKLAKEDKPTAGKNLGKARGRLSAAIKARQGELEAIEAERALVADRVDVTTAAERSPRGARHPLSLVIDDISDFFVSLGWEIAEGPEVEHEWFNFDALNFGPDHPARQMQDTFFIDGVEGTDGAGHADGTASNMVLRTHTSPVQAHTLLERDLPIYVACPGKVFRTDALDATHTPVFHQVEGIAVDRALSMADLKGMLNRFARHMFGPEARVRLRPSFFPFTEPSAEMDLWFPAKKGGAGWIEWGGCGMINPAVLENCGIDSSQYQGYAFGMGLERTLMFHHMIGDIHDIVEGDIRFSQQFGTTGKGR